jgi:hypothetical protein
MLADTAANLLANEEMKEHYLGAHAHIKEARQRRRDEKQALRGGIADGRDSDR